MKDHISEYKYFKLIITCFLACSLLGLGCWWPKACINHESTSCYCENVALINIVKCFCFEKIQVKNKIVREVIDFVKGHQSLFDQVLRLEIAEADELRMEQINLVVGILSKVLFSLSFLCFSNTFD